MADIEKKFDRNTETILNRLDEIDKRLDKMEKEFEINNIKLDDVLAFAAYMVHKDQTDFTIKDK